MSSTASKNNNGCGEILIRGNNKMKKSKILALLLAVLMVFSVFTACGTDTTSTPADDTASTAETSDAAETDDTASEAEAEDEPATGETGMYPGTPGTDEITINIASEPPELNTVLATDTISFQIFKHIFENLVMLDENDAIVPGAAESWDISDDETVYTFHLREGMTWSNDAPVTANDYAFAIKTLLTPETAASYAYFGYIIKNAAAFTDGTGTWEDVGVNVIDDLTLEITLESPTAYALDCFSFGSFAPINEAFYNEVGADKYGTEAEYLISNGAYDLTTWSHESEVIITKNDGYWDAANRAQIKTIKMVMISDSNASLNAFKAGEVDMIGLTGDQVTMLNGEGFATKQYNDGSAWYLEMNVVDTPLENKNIRSAIAYAIDRDAYVAAIEKNNSQAATSLVPPGVAGLNGDFQKEVGELIPAAGDIEKAKSFLEAGLSELGMTAEELGSQLTMITDDGDKAMLIGAFIKEQLNVNLGVDITIESMPFKSRLDRMDNHDFSLVFAGWGPDYNDPNTFLDLFVTGSGNNHTQYSNPAYDELVSKAATELDPATRMGYFVELEKIICDDLMVAPVYWRVRDYAVSDKVTGEYRTMFQDWNFTRAAIK